MILFCQENVSDIGYIDAKDGLFVYGPITELTENILLFHDKSNLNLHFISRKNLKKAPITLKGKKKKEKLAAGKGHSNLAYKLAYKAMNMKCDVAILMRDADNRAFKDVYNEIVSGFQAAGFENGIPAVPVPKSEAWLICCLDTGRSSKIETCKEDMKQLLERLVADKGLKNNIEAWKDIAKYCDLENVDSYSFKQYINDLKRITLYLF